MDLSPSSSLRLISPFEVDNASSNSSTVDDDESDEESSAKVLGIVIRGSFIVICTLLATFVPCFGMVNELITPKFSLFEAHSYTFFFFFLKINFCNYFQVFVLPYLVLMSVDILFELLLSTQQEKLLK